MIALDAVLSRIRSISISIMYRAEHVDVDFRQCQKKTEH